MSDITTVDRPWLRFYEPGVPHTLSYPRATVQSLLDDSAAQFGDRSAAVFFGAALSYRALRILVDRFAGALHRLGVQPGDRVSLHLPNCPQFLVAYYGALRAGAVVVPFNPLYVEREIEHQLIDSGADGITKGARLSQRNVVCNVLQARAWFTGLRPGQDSTLAVIPFFHSYGMTAAMNLSISAGTRLILLPRFQVEIVLGAIAKYRPQLFPGVPTLYTAIISHPHVTAYSLRSGMACISGAAPLPVEVQTRFEHLTGGKLVEGYGLTEASPVTHANPISGLRKIGSIGVPFPDTDARIMDGSGGRVLPPREVGELGIRGPPVIQGYWNHAAETAQILRDGWLFTGDLARMDADGFFYIVDRKKEMIITGGLNVFPREVEEVLYAHPGVLEAAAIGVRDPYRGEAVKAFVVLREGAHATADEITEHCRRNLAPYKVPRAVEFRTQLPKSIVGKILRRVLMEEERGKY